MQPTPEFYLPALKPKEMLRSSEKKQQQQGLRWGILGLGRIAHDFTSA
jgi:phosphoglycerate dehydrogenase-like enzyme